MSTSVLRAWVLTVACSVGCSAVWAQAPTPTPPGPALAQALESAWQHRQAALASRGRIRQAQAESLAARAWLPAPPAIELATRSDRWQADSGETEHELGVSWPLWLPGQREARQAAADAGLAWAEASAAADRLQLAGEVRQRAWAVLAARGDLQQAKAQAAGLQALADDVARRVRAGDLARTDLLEVQAELLSARAAQTDAAARLAGALADWAALTGLPDAVDPAEAAPPATADEREASHPALRLAELDIERASRALEVARRDEREAPELSLSVRQDRPGRGQPSQRSLGVALRWAFGADVRNAPLRTTALGTLDEARTTALTLRQALQAERAVARQGLQSAQAQAETASQRAELLAQRLALVDAAYRAGEADLPGLLRARSAATQAALTLTQQRVALGLARARLLQAQGQLP